MNPEIELPADETPGELIKGYFTLMRAFGFDLWVTAHFALRDTYGSHWFTERIGALQRSDPKNWNPSHRFVPQDPGVILRDYVHEEDSPYATVYGREWANHSLAKKILGTRNTWFHFGEDPTAVDLAEAASTVRSFVSGAGMHITTRIDSLLDRLELLTAGGLVTSMAAEHSARSESNEALAPVPVSIPTDLARPPIGAIWIGAIPEMRYRATKTGDVINPETLESVKGRVVGDPDEKIRAWLAVAPRGGELWIDSDGAVGGFIGASPRLLGYLGPEPEGEVARGFFLPHFYEAQGAEIVDLDRGDRLTSPIATMVERGTPLRVTTYGDVLLIDDQGFERVATVTSGEWFPGHLGGRGR